MANHSEKPNPCTSCGACCSYFRVEFYWREAERNSTYSVPIELTTDLNSFKRCMQGTEQKTGNRCIALQGKVGQQVRCTIYENRPSPCRNFQAAYEHGIPNKRCNEARMAHQLKPLDPTSSTPIGRISPGDDLEIIT